MKNNHQNEQQIDHQRRLLSKKMKTIQSIGTFNQTPQYFDQSIVCRRDIFLNNPFSLQQKQKQSTSLSQISRISKIENQVNDITKMKMMYQSRLNNQKNSKVKNISVQKSSHAKSIQKHILKPTNTPNFNKFQNKKLSMSPLPISRSNQLKHKQNIVKFSQILNKMPTQIQNSRQMLNSSNKLQSQYSQFSKRLEQYQFQQQFQQKDKQFDNRHNKNINDKYELYSNKSETPKKIVFSECKSSQPPLYRMQSSINNVQNESKNINLKCSCQQKMQLYMEQTNNKMAEITQRLMVLENQNYRLRMMESKFIQSNKIVQKFKHKLESMQQQNQLLRQSHFSCQSQKQELQSMLKQILFKRQKQKMHQSSHSSKQNTHRNQFQNRNQKYQKQQFENSQQLCKFNQKNFKKNNQNQFNNENNNSSKTNIKRGIQPLGNRNLNGSIKQKQSSQKMKVQNLLSKLQIKIQKSS